MSSSKFSHLPPTQRKRAALVQNRLDRAERHAHYARANKLLSSSTHGALVVENPLERTYKVKQSALMEQADVSMKQKLEFKLDLDDSGLSPYVKSTYSRSSRLLLVMSRKGHVATMDWRKRQSACELYLAQTVLDGCFMHSDRFFALAQKQFVFLYDSYSGAQVHVLRKHREQGVVRHLPYHLLLMSASARHVPHKRISFTDTTTGEFIAEYGMGGKTNNLGGVTDADVNMTNGLTGLIHDNGVVSMWSPVNSRPVAMVKVGSSGLANLALSNDGLSMISAEASGKVCVWDLRTYKKRSSWTVGKGVVGVDVSQRGLVSVAWGSSVGIWRKDGGDPYMRGGWEGERISHTEFCPFEDLLTVTVEKGVRNMGVLGSAEGVFDTAEANPYETRKWRREREVRVLLDKLPAETIGLGLNNVGGMEMDPEKRRKEIREKVNEALGVKRKKAEERKRAKGRNKIGKRLKRKMDNVIDRKKLEMMEAVEQERKTKERARQIKERREEQLRSGTAEGGVGVDAEMPRALNRFFAKS